MRFELKKSYSYVGDEKLNIIDKETGNLYHMTDFSLIRLVNELNRLDGIVKSYDSEMNYKGGY